jgi:hypothetical protein
MTPEQLKWALGEYSSPSFDTDKQFAVHRDEKTGHQTPLYPHTVCEAALDYIERIELLLAVAKETDSVRIYLRFERQAKTIRDRENQ